MSKRQHWPWYLYALAMVAVAIAALAVSDIGPPTSSARTSTQIVTADSGIVQLTVTGTGNVEAGTDLSVNFQTSGILSKIYVEASQHVNKGQLLATLDSSSAQLAVDEAEQNLTAAEDQLSTADANAAPSTTTTTPTTTTARPTTTTPRTTSSASAPSGGGGSAGTSNSTDPAAAVASAQAAVYSAEASVKSAKTTRADTKLYAPVSGTIVSLATLAPGDSVLAGSTFGASTTSNGSSSNSSTAGAGGTTAGSLGGSSSSSSATTAGSSTPFAEIVNTSSMTMTVALSESDISRVKLGQPATVTPDALAGVSLGAHVSAISTIGTSSNGVVSYSATLTLDQDNSQVKPGMSASASIIVAQAQGVNVPNSAVTGAGSVATVTLDKNGKEARKQVAVGLRGTTRTQIVSGLSAGDQLAVTTLLPPLSSGTATTSNSAGGTLGGSTVRPGGFGGGGFGGAAGGAPRAGASSGASAGAGAAG